MLFAEKHDKKKIYSEGKYKNRTSHFEDIHMQLNKFATERTQFQKSMNGKFYYFKCYFRNLLLFLF